MRFLLLGFLLASSIGHAQEVLNLRNDREGKSVYTTDLNKFVVKKLLKTISRPEIITIYRESLATQDAKKLCSFELNKKIKSTLESKGHFSLNYKALIYALREQNEIDDVVANILLKAHEVQNTQPLVKEEDTLAHLVNDEKTEDLLKTIASFDKKYLKDGCLDEAYRTFFVDIEKKDRKIENSLEALLIRARDEKRIADETYLMLEQARLNDLQFGGLTLQSYFQKISMLRTQYPLRDSREQSQFVTEKIKKLKLSRRQKLYESYSDLQIIMMGNIVKTLRADLESPKIEIIVHGKDTETGRKVELEPMERFRFALRSLRKEMALLSLNSYFSGRSPDYIDLMVASYEIGIIPASELDALASLEEIWNPKKTFWQKASVWITTFSSIATIVIPPPYGFIPALAVVIIQATTQGKDKDPNAEDPTSLF